MNYRDNEGHEMTQGEVDRPFAPAQSLAERMGEQPTSVRAGQLSAEHAAILSAPEGLDAREFHFHVVSGGGLREAYEKALAKAASTEVARVEVDGNSHSEFGHDGRFLRSWSGTVRPDFEGMHKILAKNALAQKADALMTEYRKGGKEGLPSITERIAALAEAALPFLSADLREKLGKAVRAMDVDLIYFFCTKALTQQAA
jgi:hypothetical protein